MFFIAADKICDNVRNIGGYTVTDRVGLYITTTTNKVIMSASSWSSFIWDDSKLWNVENWTCYSHEWSAGSTFEEQTESMLVDMKEWMRHTWLKVFTDRPCWASLHFSVVLQLVLFVSSSFKLFPFSHLFSFFYSLPQLSPHSHLLTTFRTQFIHFRPLNGNKVECSLWSNISKKSLNFALPLAWTKHFGFCWV